MLNKLIPLCALLVASAAGCAPSLATPPHLVATWPVAGASMSVARHTFELTFNHPLQPDTSWAVVWSDDGSTFATDTALDTNDSRQLRVRLLEPTGGSYLLHWHVVAADSRLALDGDQPFTLQNESPTPPRIDVSPKTADAGERIELVGKGFAKQSALQVTIGDDGLPVTTTQSDDRGTFNVEVRVPPAVPFGIQPLTAVDGEGRRATVGLEVRWGGWPPAVATDLGQPGPRPGEVSFTLNVRNRSDYMLEHVQVVMQDPEGASLVSADAGAQRENGTLVWEIPTLDRGAFGPFHATYRSDTPVTSHSWIEFRHRYPRGCTGDACLPAFISRSVSDSSPTAPAMQ
jgi:methionine-rich copper-binding protein CopC